jgi:hypothetical protein
VRRAVVLPLLLAAIGVSVPLASAQDGRAAAEAFVARFSNVQIGDVVIDQNLSLYHPDGQRPYLSGEQRMFFKVPQRQRVEQTLDGQREIQITVGNKVWVRRADGRVVELPAVEPLRALPTVLIPVKRRAEELLDEWRARGVRTDVSHVTHVGARTVTVIGSRPGDRDVPAVWLDPDYGVVRLITREQLPNGAKLVDLTLSEHRPLAGRLYFPYRQEMFVDGKLLMLFTVRAIAINTNPADALFEPASLKSR